MIEKKCKHCGTTKDLRTNKNGVIYNCCITCYKTIEVPDQIYKTNEALQKKYGSSSFGMLRSDRCKQMPKKEPTITKKTCKYCGSENIVKKGKYTYRSCELHWKQFQKDADIKRKKTNLEVNGNSNLMKLPEKIEKFKNTMLKKYGCEYPMQNPESLEKRGKNNIPKFGSKGPMSSPEVQEKSRNTVLKEYGVTSVLKSPLIQEKIKNTLLESLGVDNPLKSSIIRDKLKQTNLLKRGVEWPTQSAEVIDKRRTNDRFKYWDTFIEILKLKKLEPLFTQEEYSTGRDLFAFKCLKCEKIFTTDRFYAQGIGCSCSAYRSRYEEEIVDWLKSINIINIETNKKYGRKGKSSSYELDIYLPDFNLGIDFHGLFWHSDQVQTRKYHQDKYVFFKNIGIYYIQIFENEWLSKCNIVKSIILSKLHKTTAIYARKCNIKEISSIQYREFLEANHLQGYVSANIRLGLFYEDKLVSICSFSKSRYDKSTNCYELIRSCTLLNYSIIGGFQKLLKYFEDTVKPEKLISYINVRYFDGSSYLSSNFNIDILTAPNYFYFHLNNMYILYSREKFQKHKLEKILTTYDKNLSESENMFKNKYLRIYDAGNLKAIKEYTY